METDMQKLIKIDKDQVMKFFTVGSVWKPDLGQE